MTFPQRRECEWRVEVSDRFGPCFVHGGELEHVLYMDGPEWCLWVQRIGDKRNVMRGKVKLVDVVELAPELREEAIGMTRAALLEERARLAACLRDGLAAVAAEDDERAAAVLDELRTWGTRDLRAELSEVPA